MENFENERILSFDLLFTSNHIQILKVLLPYFDPEHQKKLVIMIKYLELQYAIEYFRRNPCLPGAFCNRKISEDEADGKDDIISLFSQIKAFCTPSERAVFDQLSSLKKNMDKYGEVMQMMQMFSEFSDLMNMESVFPFTGSQDQTQGKEDGRFSSNSINPMDMLKNMLSDEQKAMFEMFASAYPDNKS